MADDVTLNASAGTFVAASDEIGGKHYQRVKVTFGADGTATDVSSASRFPVTLGLTDAELRASPIPTVLDAASLAALENIVVSGTVALDSGSLAALENVTVGGTVELGSASLAALESITATGPLTDAELRNSPVPVSLSGMATAANQATMIGHLDGVEAGLAPLAAEATLSGLSAKFSSLGQKTSASSAPVVIASDQSAVPVSIPDVSATGNITTQNLVPAGAATANSAVELVLSGRSGVSIQVTGTYTGALSLQGTLDGTTWVTFGGTPLLNVNTGATSATIASATQGIFQAEASAFTRIRVTALAAFTGAATVTVRGTDTPSMFALDAALPTGANAIGAVTQSGTWTIQPGNTANTTAWLANPAQLAGVTVEASSAKTTTGNGATQTNASGRGAHFFINVSASSGTTPTLTVAIQVQDPISASWVQIPGAITATITGNGLTMLTVAPGIVEAANSRISNALPRTYRLAWTIGGTSPSFTFSVGAQYII